MPEQEIYSSFKSHWDNNGDLNPAESGSGQDDHVITIPSGKALTRWSLSIDANTNGSNATMMGNGVPAGATGQQTAKVSWAFNPFGKIAYTLRAYADAPGTVPELIVWAGTPNWERAVTEGIQQRRKVKLILRGPDATLLTNALRRAQGKSPISPTDKKIHISRAVGWPEVAMAAVIVGGIVAVATLVVILVICLYAINQVYYVDMKWSRNGPMPYDDALDITLEPR